MNELPLKIKKQGLLNSSGSGGGGDEDHDNDGYYDCVDRHDDTYIQTYIQKN